ncbi:hypothetical protein TeGR_g3488, partial [Tetraparma gracilis]
MTFNSGDPFESSKGKRMQQHHTPGTKFGTMSPPKEYMYAKNSAISHDSLGGESARRLETYNQRAQAHSESREAAHQREIEEHQNEVVLRKKDKAEALLRRGMTDSDERARHLHSEPMNVVASLRERCRQKPQLLSNLFPPSSTSSLGMLTTEDIGKGLKTMGFDLAPQKLQLVITILGLSQLLSDGRSIPLHRLKVAVLAK